VLRLLDQHRLGGGAVVVDRLLHTDPLLGADVDGAGRGDAGEAVVDGRVGRLGDDYLVPQVLALDLDVVRRRAGHAHGDEAVGAAAGVAVNARAVAVDDVRAKGGPPVGGGV